jgi:hypothetical protein
VPGSVIPCVFCGEVEKKLTNGHIFGKRLLDALPRAPTGTNFHGEVLYLDPTQGTWAVLERRNPRSPYQMPVKVICEDCNSAWMNRHEMAVLPILLKVQKYPNFRFTRAQQRTLAAWISIAAILSEYVSPSTLLSTTAAERLALCKTSTPPATTRIWLGRSGEVPAMVFGMVHRLDPLIAEDDGPRRSARRFYGMVFGPFAAAVIGGVSSMWVKDEPNTRPTGAFQRLWPLRRGDRQVAWTAKTPRPVVLDLDLLRRTIAAELTGYSGPTLPWRPGRP